MLDKLRHLPIPEELTRKRLDETLAQALLGSAELEPYIDEIVQVLRSQELSQLINEGEITLAMIKPRLEDAISDNAGVETTRDDASLAALLEHSIQPPLSSVFEVSMIFTEEMVNEWYGGSPKERQLQLPPENPHRYGMEFQNRWEEFMALMTKGPVTFLLLYDEGGNAVQLWREQMGNDWHMIRVKEKYPDSLRARYGVDNHNNLLHGSDSPESVRREVAFVADKLEKMTDVEP